MIPNGMNPHGLEDRTLTFCVLQNNQPMFTCRSQNRMYCWATFPDQINNYLRSTYGVTDIRLSIERAADRESWNDLQKYVSKEIVGDHFMVHENQTFYYQSWGQSHIPEFATIYVLDTSGSMSSSDYTKVKRAVTGEIYDYNCHVWQTSDSMMFFYSADYLKNMKVAESMFGSLLFGQASLSKIWSEVSPFIDGIPKHSSSETMITNLYYSICNFLHRMFEVEDMAKPGKLCKLMAAAFALFTDESIFTRDTLRDLNYLYDNTQAGGKWYHEWFAKWQGQATNKFPSVLPSGTENQVGFCQAITDALRQMSYYYGVNFTWSLYRGISTSADFSATYGSGTAPAMDTIKSFNVNKEEVTYKEGGGIWLIPEKFHTQYPHAPMCRIGLVIPTWYIIDGKSALKDYMVMQYDHQFDQNQTLSHFHKDSYNEYSAFRFLRTAFDEQGKIYTMKDKSVPLPSTSQMNLKMMDPITGNSYQYTWETYGQSKGVPTKVLQPGASYNVDDQDVSINIERPTIMFRLVQTEIKAGTPIVPALS